MNKIESFDFEEGSRILGKYEVLNRLGSGWEGEVYKIKELSTGIERAAKLFYPHRNVRNKSARVYAQKLHRLRQCRMLIHYHTEELLYIDGIPITMLISEYVEGELLSQFMKRFRGQRLTPFQGIHLLHALSKGIEEIHLLNEYHGDLHTDNVLINRYGLRFDVKLLDLFHWGDAKRANRDKDLCDLIRIFYDCLGGAKTYAQQPPEVKYICSGLKSSLILEKFRIVSQLREHLENLVWSE